MPESTTSLLVLVAGISPTRQRLMALERTVESLQAFYFAVHNGIWCCLVLQNAIKHTYFYLENSVGVMCSVNKDKINWDWLKIGTMDAVIYQPECRYLCVLCIRFACLINIQCRVPISCSPAAWSLKTMLMAWCLMVQRNSTEGTKGEHFLQRNTDYQIKMSFTYRIQAYSIFGLFGLLSLSHIGLFHDG